MAKAPIVHRAENGSLWVLFCDFTGVLRLKFVPDDSQRLVPDDGQRCQFVPDDGQTLDEPGLCSNRSYPSRGLHRAGFAPDDAQTPRRIIVANDVRGIDRIGPTDVLAPHSGEPVNSVGVWKVRDVYPGLANRHSWIDV